jgi:Sec-independent protein translocase protein TatA
MNKTTLIIVLFVLGFIGIVAFIHYEIERSREKNARAVAKIIKEDFPEAVRETADKIPEVIRKTGDAIREAASRQASAAEQPTEEISSLDATDVKQSLPQDDRSTPPTKEDSTFKSPAGVIFEIGTAVIKEADKAAREFLPPLTSDEEKQIGAEINKMILKDTPEWKETALVKKASAVFIKLFPFVKRKDISYRMAVLDDGKIINAYAAPGGYIYVTRALLERFNSEAAIAMCLGHEIGHQELHHTTDRLRAMMAARKIVGSDIATIAQLGYQTLTNCYTKEQEFEADEFGFRISLKIGIQKEQMLFFLSELNSIEKEREKKAGATSDVSPILHDMEYFLQSHPYTDERLERLRNK